MKRESVISIIQQHAEAIAAFGVQSVYLFGSTARNEAGHDSDIDLFIDRKPGQHVGFIELTDLQFYLEELLKSEVDLTTRTALHPTLKPLIEAEAIKVI